MDFTTKTPPTGVPVAPPNLHAVPGEVDCDMDLGGLTLVHSQMVNGNIALVLRGQGQGQFVRDGKRHDAGGETQVVVWEKFWAPSQRFGQTPGTSLDLDEYASTLREWVDQKTPLRIVQVVGKSSTLTGPDGTWLPVPRSRDTVGF